MRTRHAACLVRVCTLLALVLPVLPGHVLAAPPAQGTSSSEMFYHELMQRPEGSPPIQAPILSGDGRRVIWAESPADLKQSNQIFALDVDGGQSREIDAYQPLCSCQTQVDVSDDGTTVVSTEGVRIRRLSGGASLNRKNELIRLADNVISALRISGDGKLVVFLVARDTTTSEPNPLKLGTPIPRGVWAMSADAGALKQMAGIEEVAVAAEVPVAELAAYPEFSSFDTNALDVSDDGRRIVFGAQSGFGIFTGKAEERVFNLGEILLTQLFGPVESVDKVAVSGDGKTVAFATADQGVTTVSVKTGGTLKPLPNFAYDRFQRFDERLQLSRDGTKLLGREQQGSVLVDVATLTRRRLVPLAIPESHLFTGGAANYATMNAAGTRVLYVASPHGGNLVVIDLGATVLRGAPLVRGLNLDPDTIPRDGSKRSSVSTEISWDGTLIGVWLEIFRDGVRDTTFGDSGLVPMQDTSGPDPGRMQGIFAADLVSRDKNAVPGPRQLRLITESQAEDGRRHGTVFEPDKTLTVGGIGLGSYYNGELAVGDAQIAARLTNPPGDFKGLRDVRATIQLDPTTNALLGGSLSYVAFMDDPSLPRRHEFNAATARSLEPFTVLPGGILGNVIFQGELTIYDSDGSVFLGPIEAEQDFHYADDPSGQLVLCATGRTLWTLEEAELARQACVENAFITLKPGQAAPPVA
jgi:hypothetical protein